MKKKKNWKTLSHSISLLIMFGFLWNPMEATGQQSPAFNSDAYPSSVEEKSPRAAMFRSFLIPGWGHYHANPNDWRRGQYYLAADVVLVTSLTLLAVNSGLVENNMFTFARSYSGTDLQGKARTFQIAVANFNSLAAYNAQQERTFNWERMFADTPENFWEWESEDHRLRYGSLRSKYDRINRQIPTIISMMVANRLISGVGSFIQVRNQSEQFPQVSFSYHADERGQLRPAANVRFHF